MIAAYDIDEDDVIDIDLDALHAVPLRVAQDRAPAGPAAIEPCGACGGTGREVGVERFLMRSLCLVCEGIGYFGIDPRRPTDAPRGSLLKTAVIAVRYREGLDLFHPEDCGGPQCAVAETD